MAKVLSKCSRVFGNFIFAVLLLHIHIFLLPIFCLGGFVKKWVGEMLINAAVMITPPIVVILINEVGGVYPEIQSWQISWIIWGCSVFVIGAVEQIYGHYYGAKIGKSTREAIESYAQILVAPFGIRIDTEHTNTEDVYKYICPLVALAPAIVGGYMANFFLEKRYFLDCDVRYNDISTMCIDEICCVAANSHEDWIDFLPKIASSSVAAWGVIKALGTFLIVYDDNVVKEETENAGRTTTDNQS